MLLVELYADFPHSYFQEPPVPRLGRVVHLTIANGKVWLVVI